jgi:choline dehydrogenase-like flavoprotein
VLEQQRNPATLPALRRVGARLLRHALDFKALPLYPLLQVTPAGRGFHNGGTFPMREAPGPFECDVLGRPHGFSRVHVVDSTTFPTIPSTTITFTAMANAHRIASAAGDL